MRVLRRIVARWLPLAGVVVALAILNGVSAQQLLRGSADEPQVQLARDAARALAAGRDAQLPLGSAPVDVSTSLAPFIIVYDPTGTVTFSTARLNGNTPELPGGVLAEVSTRGEARFTWQPSPDARLAAVVVPIANGSTGYVLVGRSLVETEARIQQAQALSALGAAIGCVAVLVLVEVVEMILPDDKT